MEKTLQKSSYDKIEAKTLQWMGRAIFCGPPILKLSFDEPLMCDFVWL